MSDCTEDRRHQTRADIDYGGECEHGQPMWGVCRECRRADPIDPDWGRSALLPDAVIRSQRWRRKLP